MRAQVLVLGLVTLLAGLARADDKTAAEAQFVKAKKLLKDGKTAEACAAFESSQALDPQQGTRYNLAICYQDLGKTASAWVIFRELAQLDTNAKRKADSAKRADDLEGKLTKLLITTGSRVAGLKISRDGVDITNVMGIEDPIDPGRYHLTATAEGYQPWETDVEVTPGNGATVTVEIPALEPVTAETHETPVDTHETHEVAAPTVTKRITHPGKGRKLLGLATAGAGAVALGVGLYAGALASGYWEKVVEICGDDRMCETPADLASAQPYADRAGSNANLSSAMVGVGIVAVAAGVILYVTAPHDRVEIVPQVGAGGVGLAVAGAF